MARMIIFVVAIVGFYLVLPSYVELNCWPRDCDIKRGEYRALLYREQRSELWRKYQNRLGHGEWMQ
jgi:hypothetical protein